MYLLLFALFKIIINQVTRVKMIPICAPPTQTLLSSSKEDIKQYAAELYSVVAHHALTEAQYIDTVDKFIKLTNDKVWNSGTLLLIRQFYSMVFIPFMVLNFFRQLCLQFFLEKMAF